MKPGHFITFEGPEGSGKTTQAKRLAERLAQEGAKTLYTREPGGTALGEEVRAILQHDRTGEAVSPEAELLLFAASRAQLVAQVIRPALEAGSWVVCDRFADSTTVYQGYARGFDLEQVLAINDVATGGLRPARTVLVDVSVEVGFSRIETRNEETGAEHDRFEREEREFHEKVRAGYLDLAARFPDRFRVVAGNRAADEVAADIWEVVADVGRDEI